jgi:beta-lactamase regulating signal transducer with metallopeptidase domain
VSLALLCALGLLAAPGIIRRVGRRLPPAEWAKLCTASIAAGALTLEAALLALGAPTVLRAAGFDAFAEVCEHLLGKVTPGPVVGSAAVLAAIFLVVRTGCEVLRTRRIHQATWVEADIGLHAQLDCHQLVIMPNEQLFAFSVNGHPGQVIVSRGMVKTLTTDELDAVLHHELAHLRHRHQRHLLAASVAERILAALPFVRRSTATLRCALERWADEDAADGVAGGRESVRSALLRVTQATVTEAVPAFAPAFTIVERIEALQAAPVRDISMARRAVVYVPTLVLGTVAAAGLEAVFHESSLLHTLLALCPT